MMHPKVFSLVLMLAALLNAGCKSMDGDQSTVSEGGYPQEVANNGEPVLVCSVQDQTEPRYEVEIFPTGFDPQRGTTVAVVVRKVGGAESPERTSDGHGELTDASLDVLFDQGKLTAEAQSAAEGRVYVGNLEFGGDFGESATRGVRCQ